MGFYANQDIQKLIFNFANSNLNANNTILRPQHVSSLPVPCHESQFYSHQPQLSNLFAARLAQGLTMNNASHPGINCVNPSVHPVQNPRFPVPNTQPNSVFNRLHDMPHGDIPQNVLQYPSTGSQNPYVSFPVAPSYANPPSYYPAPVNHNNVSNQSSNNSIPNAYSGVLVGPTAGQSLMPANQQTYVIHQGQFLNQPQNHSSANEYLSQQVNGSHGDTVYGSNPVASNSMPVQTVHGIPSHVAPQYNQAHVAPGINSFFASIADFQGSPTVDTNQNPSQPNMLSASGIAPNHAVAGTRTILTQNHPFNQQNVPQLSIYQQQVFPNPTFRLPQNHVIQSKVASSGQTIPGYPVRGAPHFNIGQINQPMVNNSSILKTLPRFIGYKLSGPPVVSTSQVVNPPTGIASVSNGVNLESSTSTVRNEERVLPVQINE